MSTLMLGCDSRRHHPFPIIGVRYRGGFARHAHAALIYSRSSDGLALHARLDEWTASSSISSAVFIIGQQHRLVGSQMLAAQWTIVLDSGVQRCGGD